MRIGRAEEVRDVDPRLSTLRNVNEPADYLSALAEAGFEPTDKLRREILGYARKRLGAVVAPKEIEFLTSLPRTRSGKIMRRLLKARELGQPEGDTSTLEPS